MPSPRREGGKLCLPDEVERSRPSPAAPGIAPHITPRRVLTYSPNVVFCFYSFCPVLRKEMRGMKYAFGNADLPAGTAPAGHSRIDRPKVKRNARPGAGLDPLLA